MTDYLQIIHDLGERQKHLIQRFKCPHTHTKMLYHWKALHLCVTIRSVVELASGAVSVNPRSNKVTIKRSILEIGLF